MTKGKSPIGIKQLGRLIKPHSYGIFICSRCISLLEFSVYLSFSFKTIANSNGQIRRPCADAGNECIKLITQINSYLPFSFFFHDNVFAIGCRQIVIVWWKEHLQFMVQITDNVIKKPATQYAIINAPKWVLSPPLLPSCTFLRLLLILLFSRAVPALSLSTGGDR